MDRMVQLKTDLMRVDGGMFRAGSTMLVQREYLASGLGDRDAVRWCLGDESGRVLLPCVDPKLVEEVAT